jgi:hypothetical protein
MRQTDADFLLAVLRETPNEFVSQAEILRRSQADRGCGLTVHSRIADLRRRGYSIPPALCIRAEDGRVTSYYRILEPPLREAGSVVPVWAIPSGSNSFLGRDGESGFSERGGSSPAGRGLWDGRPPEGTEPEEPSPLVLFSVTRRPPWA